MDYLEETSIFLTLYCLYTSVYLSIYIVTIEDPRYQS